MQPQQQQQQQQQPQQSDSPGFLTKSYSQPVSSSRSSSMNMSASSSVAVSASAELSAAATLSHILTAYAHCLQPLQPSLPSDAPLLPVVKCRDACHAIASSTLAHLLAFPSDATSYNVVVLDCRYPYEFEGGHIQGAVNVPNPECLEALLLRRDENGQYVGAYDGSRTILVFHCEFSSRRGPRMVQHLRGVDRKANLASYPSLFYPHVFLLEGGYASFVSQHGNLCSPECGYVKMHDERYSDELNRTSTEARRSWGMRRGSSFLGRQSVPS
jgi:rhodanese-related sulfurtransferase